MTDKALIKKRGISRSSDAFSLENKTAIKFGFSVEKSSPEGTLISGEKEQFRKLESEGFRVKVLPATNILRVGSYEIDIEKGLTEIAPELQIPEDLKDIWTHYLVQLQEPPTEDLIKLIEEKNVDVVEPISSYGLFVVGNIENINKLSNLTFVSWVGPFLPAYRINKNVLSLKGNIKYVNIGVYPPSDIENVKKKIQEINSNIANETKPTKGYQGEYATLLVEVNSQHLSTLARLPSVRWLEYASPVPGLDGERESQIVARNLHDVKPIPGYKSWLSDIQLTGKDVVISICDTGVDANEENNTIGHSDLKGRQVTFIDYTNGTIKTDIHGHGTHVAGICLGNAGTEMKEGDPPEDFLWGHGIAPQSHYVTQNALFGPWPPHDWGILTGDAVNNGAHIMNNSWWDLNGIGIGYTANTRRFDELSRDPTESTSQDSLVIIFSAGNSGPNYNTITSPHEAKNPIIVGNSLTYRLPDYKDIRGIARSSSRGPAKDGRIRPDIVAPGTFVPSAWSKTGDPNEWNNRFVPGTNNMYMFGTGTSMAAPQISGCCALLTEWWKKRTNGKIPSLALLKALLINSAVDLAGGPTGRSDGSVIDHIPNNDQGWGLVNLKRILQKTSENNNNSNKESKIISDQKNPFTSSGQEHSIQVRLIDKNNEMRITLVWTDAPGAPNASPVLVNDLDLEITEIATGKIYKGNVFSDGYSTSGGDFDNLNNVECVYIKNPVGEYEIRIIASNIALNARPPFDKTPWQDYALVVDNARPIEGTNDGIII
jgi:hypothetical protein